MIESGDEDDGLSIDTLCYSISSAQPTERCVSPHLGLVAGASNIKNPVLALNGRLGS